MFVKYPASSKFILMFVGINFILDIFKKKPDVSIGPDLPSHGFLVNCKLACVSCVTNFTHNIARVQTFLPAGVLIDLILK